MTFPGELPAKKTQPSVLVYHSIPIVLLSFHLHTKERLLARTQYPPNQVSWVQHLLISLEQMMCTFSIPYLHIHKENSTSAIPLLAKFTHNATNPMYLLRCSIFFVRAQVLPDNVRSKEISAYQFQHPIWIWRYDLNNWKTI